MTNNNKLPFELEKREVIVRLDEATDQKYGKSPSQLTMQELLQCGFVVINKPRGPTSHQISEYVKLMLGTESAGHSGTLDPNVTGVLPVALTKATKVQQALLNAGKEYVCLMHIHQEYSEEKIRNTCKKFVGDIMQLPPVKSAVKRELRKRTIYYLDVLEVDGKDVLFKVGCQAGTYIRKLCSDIGEKLGSGAHMQQLIRTKAASFNDKEMISLNELADAHSKWVESGDETQLRKFVHNINHSVSHLAHIWVGDGAINPICHGAPLAVPGVLKIHTGIKKGDMIAIMSLKDELVCLAKAEMSTDQILKEKNGIAAVLTRVVMDENTYPKIRK